MPEIECLDDSIAEVSEMTAAKLTNPQIKQSLEQYNVLPAMLFAIIMYTFDLCLISPYKTREQNFYYALNVHLRQRSPEFLRDAHGYLYYLMTGLGRLPAYVGDFLYRGIDASGAVRAR